LKGRLHVVRPDPRLDEYAWFNGKAYIFVDPFPAILLLPLAAIWGQGLDIAQVAIGVGVVNVGLMRLVLGRLGVARSTANWCVLLFAFGTVHFFAAEYGNTWLLGHLTAVAALTLAWLVATGSANPFLLGLCSAIAAASRSPALLGCPVFLALALRRRPSIATAVWFVLP
jgi:hypothetical protein